MLSTVEAETNRIREAVERVNAAAVIDSSGRGGNLFFLTLFDRHPEVACCPIVQYSYSYVMAEFANAVTIDAATAHEFVTQKSYFRLLYNEPIGANGQLLTRMGGQATAPVERVRLRKIIDAYFGERGEVTRREVIAAPLLAYMLAQGADLDRIKFILIGDAISQRREHVSEGFSGQVVECVLEDFPGARLFRLVRDPRATFASPRHQFVNSLGNMYAIEPGKYFQRLRSLSKIDLQPDNGCVYLYWLMYLRQSEVAIRAKAAAHPTHFLAVRNEDLNLDFVPTMRRLSRLMEIEHLDAWQTSEFVPTVCGVPWSGAGAYNSRYQRATTGPLPNDPEEVSRRVTGPNEYVTRRWRTRLNRREIEMIERLFRRDLEEYGYEILYDRPDRSDLMSMLRTALLPFEGELPTLRWLQTGFSAGWLEFWRRAFYAISFPPFYLISRIKLFDLVLRRRFFRSNDQAGHPCAAANA
jgi:hypothetical protein